MRDARRRPAVGRRHVAPPARWRSGARAAHVRVAASLREPTVYRNPGVPDERRALARRGIALVGSVKSAALVEVVAPWVAPSTSGPPAFGRGCGRSLLARSGPWSARSAGVATAIVDRRSHGARAGRRAAAAGGRDLSRHRDLRRNIAILTVLLVGALRLARRAAARRRSGDDRRAAGLRPGHRARGLGRSRHCRGRRVSRRRASRSSRVLAQRARRRGDARPAAVADGRLRSRFLLSFGATLGDPDRRPRLATLLARSARVRAGRWRVARSAALVRWPAIDLRPTIAPRSRSRRSRRRCSARVTVAGLLLNFAAIPLMTIVQAGSLAALARAAVDPEHARVAAATSCTSPHAASSTRRGSSTSRRGSRATSRRPRGARWPRTTPRSPALAAASRASRARRCRDRGARRSSSSPAARRRARRRGACRRRGRCASCSWTSGRAMRRCSCCPIGRALLVDAGGLPAAPLQDPHGRPGLRHRRARRRARAARVRRARARHARADARRSRSHRRRAAVLRSFRPRAVWEGVPVPPHRAARSAGSGRRDAHRRRVADGAGRRSTRASPASRSRVSTRRCRTGSGSASATTTRSCSRCRFGDVLVVLPGRHRHAKASRRAGIASVEAVAAHDAEGPAPRQRDVEHAGVPRARCGRRP